ncbi:MAG: hypothetical protein M5U34_47940 [Chloroflexi bacterium]|nr:hypothetical protein [Chloroflexota bacterium]
MGNNMKRFAFLVLLVVGCRGEQRSVGSGTGDFCFSFEALATAVSQASPDDTIQVTGGSHRRPRYR